MDAKTTASIQWKGTDVCADLECKCGWAGHFDGFFMHSFKCPDCCTVYKMPALLEPEEIGADDLHYKSAVIPESDGE